jgi:hypothetical protein
MKRFVITGMLLLTLSAPAFAAQQHFAVKDTQGNCSVIDVHPSATNISGLTILGNKGGYGSASDAKKALSSASGCKGVIDRT